MPGRASKLLSQRVVDEVIFDVDSSRFQSSKMYFCNAIEEGVRTRVASTSFPNE